MMMMMTRIVYACIDEGIAFTLRSKFYACIFSIQWLCMHSNLASSGMMDAVLVTVSAECPA